MDFEYLDENRKEEKNEFSTTSTTLCIYDEKYTLSKSDVHHLLFRTFSLSGKTYRTILVLILFTIWFTYVYPNIEDYTKLSAVLTLILLIVVCSIWFYPLIYMLVSAKRASFSGHTLHLMIFDTYVSMEEKGVISNFPYNKDLDIYEDSRYFLFFLSKSVGTILPKSQINKVKIIELRNLFTASLGEQFHRL